MKSSEDFLELVLEAHLVSAAKQLTSNNGNEKPSEEISELIVEKLILLPTSEYTSDDGVQLYAKEVLTLGLVWLNNLNATR